MTPRDAAIDPALADAWHLFIRLVEGGAFADLGLADLFPPPLRRNCSAEAELRRRAEELTGASAALVDEVLYRLYGWSRR